MTQLQKHSTIAGGRFVLDEKIGTGGVGEVWRARGARGGRKFALKLLRAEYTGNPQLRRRFAREARAASSLSHPNIAAVYAFGGDTDEQLYIAMELVEGSSVSHAVQTGLSYRNILELADQLLAGLAHAHARGVIHRDLKPDNILLSGARLPESIGIPKLVDFGIATVAMDSGGDDRETMQGEVVGTPRYMSPEQALGERNLGPRTDIYNVGLILYELVTGEPPFGDVGGLAVMSRHVHDPIPEIEVRAGLEVPDAFIDVVMRALEKKALDRWSSAGEMRRALSPLLEAAREDPEANQAPQPLASALVEGTPDPHATTPGTRPELIVAMRDEFFLGGDPAFGAWNARAPYVGREEERAFLQRLVERMTSEGQGSIVLLDGEAGVGKTRLTNWLKEQVEERGVLRANVGAFTRGGSSSLRGVQEVLETMFRTRGLPRKEVAHKVRRRLQEWGHDSPEDAAALIDFIRPTSHDDTRPAEVSTSALFALIVRVIEIAAQRKPRLIILDDIHWAGRELADFLDFLAVEMRHRAIPILLLATIRTEDLAERPELESRLGSLNRYMGETVERLTLERLDADAGARLVETLLPCDPRLTEIILDRTGCNPLHLLLLLRYLRQEDFLEWRDGKWHAVDLEQVAGAVPPSLGDLFKVRIEQAESHYNTNGRLFRLLQLAAICGSRFQYDVLRMMTQLAEADDLLTYFDYDLDRLLAEGFIVEIDGRGDDWYACSHGLLRDYLVHATGPVIARRLHRAAAEALTAVMEAQADTFAFEIASHWRQAHEPMRALAWYQRAAETARRSYVQRQAAAAFEAALSLMDEQLGIATSTLEPLGPGLGSADFAQRGLSFTNYLELVSRLGDVYEGFGEYGAAELAYRRVVRMAGKEVADLDASGIRPLGYSWLGLGHVAWQRGDFEAAEWAFKKVREIVRDRPGTTKLENDATRGLARVAWHRGEYARARQLAQSSGTSARQIEDTEGEAESLWILGEIERMLGREGAREYYNRSLQIYQEGNIPTGIARNLLSLAQFARYHKDFEHARELYSRALAHYENLGDRRGQGMCHNGLGDIARFEKFYEDAEQFYARALEIYETIGAEYDIAVALANLGLNAMRQEAYDAARGYLEAAQSIVDAGDYPYLLAGIEYNLALVHALQGKADDPQLAHKVLDLAHRIPIADIDYAEPLERLAHLRAEVGGTADARALWEKAREIYDSLGLSEDSKRVEASLAEDS